MHVLVSRVFFVLVTFVFFGSQVAAQRPRPVRPAGQNADSVLLQIVRAEDERRWDKDLESLLGHEDPKIRKRAALAAGRIGDPAAVSILADLLVGDRDPGVRQMAAFAMGEIESAGAAYSLITALKDPARPGRARAIEALGKVTAALAATMPTPAKDAARPDDRVDVFNAEILGALRFENNRRATPDRLTVLLGLTAALRTRPEASGGLIKEFLTFDDPRIVADALNTLARLRFKEGNDQARALLVKHSDPIVRANAARVLGATEDKQAFDALLDRALNDSDLRVRVSAIRAMGSLKDERAALSLSRRASSLLTLARLNGASRNEAFEILTALGLILAGKPGEDSGELAAATMELHLRVRATSNENILEDEIARARQAPEQYLDYLKGFEAAAALPTNSELAQTFYNWRSISARAAALGEIGRIKPAPSIKILEAVQARLRSMLEDRRTPTLAVANVLNAYSVFKPKDLNEHLLRYLAHSDVIIRSTAAGLLGEQTPGETNTAALIQALPAAYRDKDNDAALAILDALAKQKNTQANDAIKKALESRDHLLRRRAVALLKAIGAGDFSNRIGTVQTRNTIADYRRAIARVGKKVTATVVTNKGSFTIEFLPEDAPLTVDNFVQLAKRGYFNGQTVPRVVPNFVIQTGDPRGDQNGGPGYQIRCEINEVPYERGAVGMALSGKDTGGSQWFVTHSPQPHLDGGYTVFGRVIAGMDVVDRIARGDTIRRVVVNER